MKYILASKDKCQELGIKISGHITKDSRVVLNEKEVAFSPVLSDLTIEEKANMVDGVIYNTASELLNIINS